MKEKYYDVINKQHIEIQVNAKVSHFLAEERFKNKKLSAEQIKKLSNKEQEEYYQRDFERNLDSLDGLLEDGFQPTNSKSIEDELSQSYKERKYLNSPQYKQFRNSLKQELVKAFDVMPDYLKQVMFLRFFKELSISQIADCLNYSKSTAQSYIGRGCAYIKNFLEKDIKEQNRLECLAREKRAKKLAALQEKNKKN